MKIVNIEGAVVFPEAKHSVDDENIKIEFAPMNMEYRYLVGIDGFPWVSKDMKDWCLTVGVQVNGEMVNPMVLIMAVEEDAR